MNNALIGYTGFVGSNLLSQRSFESLYNSKNINEMSLGSFDDVICAGVSAVKWIANKDPDTDKDNIDSLKKILKTIKAKRFILISTVDVYPIMKNGDESFDCSSVDNHAYGSHRLEFEEFCKDNFENCYIIRLPGLFGAGLKKNIIYDLLNNNCLEMINIESSFQYYYLKNLWSDIQNVLKNEIRLVNFFTEPVPTKEIIGKYFPDAKVGGNASATIHYDLHTKNGSLRDLEGNYLYSQEEVLGQLDEFIKNYQVEMS